MAANQAIEICSGGDCAGPPGYGYGGWAWLMVQGAAPARGAAGGEKHSTKARMILRGMIEALKAAADQPAAAIALDPGDAGAARIGADLAARQAAGWRTPDGEPIEDAELWGEIARLLAARTAPVRFAIQGPPDARAFVGAWVDFARDRCRDKGAFTSAIPKPNLTTFLARAFQG